MFTQQCYMKCESDERAMYAICVKLHHLDYEGVQNDSMYNVDCAVRLAVGNSKRNKLYKPTIQTGGQSFYIHHKTTKYLSGIDCGTNEKLFLAIAALRDDSDYMQWFTDGKTWKVSDWRNAKSHFHDWYRYFGYTGTNPHKATVEELIQYFK
jgi:hypothetical protein